MGGGKSYRMTQKTVSKRVTTTKTVVVPPLAPGEDIYKYYLRLKKLGLRLPKTGEKRERD